MAPSRLDPAAAKARRQKLIAIGGAAVLVLLLAVQVPRTLKLLDGGGSAAPAPAATAAPAAPTAAPEEPVAGETAASAAPASAPAAELVDSDPPVVAGEGQLVSFDRFETKDPFRQQAEPVAAEAPPATKPAPKPQPPKATAPPLTVVPSQSTAPASTAPVATETTIEVNGTPEAVQTGASFPAADPLFVLAERGADGESVKVEVAGGEYSDGRPSVVLKLGETVTLMNTASGARYALKLLAVGPS